VIEATLAQENSTKVLTVEELNRQIRQLLEGELPLVWLQGEISNFKPHSSGHFYFSMKDSKAQISAVMFRGHNSRLKFKPADGMEVIARGRITVYEPRGNYQITIETMEPVGAGALQKSYEQLKEKLKAEGLFDAKKKRPLPNFPKLIALVTSPTGAAIRDMLNVLSRRNKSVKVILVPTIVQGEAAAPQIVEALDRAFRIKNVDAIIVGRGGGSIEDMWCFNDEKVARKIAAAPVPIISAVGHEIDFTIADFVADMRAPTPSAAAELIVKNAADVTGKLKSLQRILFLALQKAIKSDAQRVMNLSHRLVDPKRKLQDHSQRNDELFSRLYMAAQKLYEREHMGVEVLSGKLIHPNQLLERLRGRLNLANFKMKNAIQAQLELAQQDWQRTTSLLDSMSPLRVVERGYSMTQKAGQIVKSTRALKVGDSVSIRLMQGSFKAKVEEITE
jgi:exodeoxyribonuclease VII large subunit